MNQIDEFFERTVQGTNGSLSHYWLILRPIPVFHQLILFLDIVRDIDKIKIFIDSSNLYEY
jgi:hypothetical protein